jgi:hypothetical protein
MRFQHVFGVLIAIAAIAVASSVAEASVQVYSDGPSTIGGGYYVNGGQEVSDSFSVLNATTLTSAQVGLWTAPGDAPSTINWSIGTTPYGSDVSSGTSTPINNISFTTNGAWDFYQSSFLLNGPLSANTTYYLTLTGGVTAEGGSMPWDICSGPSVSYIYGFYGPYTNYGEDFSLYGNTVNAVPEPTTITIWALLGLAVGAVCLRRRW